MVATAELDPAQLVGRQPIVEHVERFARHRLRPQGNQRQPEHPPGRRQKQKQQSRLEVHPQFPSPALTIPKPRRGFISQPRVSASATLGTEAEKRRSTPKGFYL